MPIFPDDYLFFGQSLTYGYRETTQPYQPLPAVIDKVADDYYRLPQTDRSNRVFRAPAYFRSKQMSMAHFNPGAILAAYSTSETGSLEAYKDMTAVDFTGYGDVFNATNGALKQYGKEWNGNLFYPPLLDDGGLLSLRNADLTRNLLVYAPQSTVAEGTPAHQTRQTLVALATEPEYVETNADYRTVAVNQQTVTSHIVERTIAYTFMPGTRMWYQRAPLYANQSKGWEGVSLPFEVELVTTQTKGELSHFYTGSTTGHEYWLRCYKDISAVTGQEEKAKAVFSFPDAVSGRYKDYTNTFLWDYYYSQEDRQDQNTDIYKTYYNQTHTYEGYPLQQAGTPYLAGFPGERYYEFDLSGRFVPQNTMSRIEQLGTQVITFASQTEEHIGVSDDNMHPLTHNGYTFVPSYMSTSLAAGTMAYALNSDGSSYDLMAATGDAVVVQPFRPYFTVAGNNARPAQSIIFSDENSSDLAPESRHHRDDNHHGRHHHGHLRAATRAKRGDAGKHSGHLHSARRRGPTYPQDCREEVANLSGAAGKVSPEAPEQCYKALGELLQLSCSNVTEPLEKAYGGLGNIYKRKNRELFGRQQVGFSFYWHGLKPVSDPHAARYNPSVPCSLHLQPCSLHLQPCSLLQR